MHRSLRFALLLLALVSMLAAGCSNTGGKRKGDAISTPPTDTGKTTADAVGTDTAGTDTAGTDTAAGDGTLADSGGAGGGIVAIQKLDGSLNCDDAKINTLLDSVNLAGVVVTVQKFDAFTPKDGDLSRALDGYFIAEPGGGPFSGVQLVVKRTQATDFPVGAVLSIDGSAEEFYCLTQVEASTASQTATGAAVPVQTVAAADLVNPSTAEPWEGSIVKVENVTVVSGPSNFGEYTLASGLVVDDLLMRGQLNLPLNTNLPSLTGALTFSYGSYKLVPRSAADVDTGGATPPDTTGSDTGGPKDTAGSDPGFPKDVGPAVPMTIEEMQTNAEGAACSGVEGMLPLAENVLLGSAIVVSPRAKLSANLDGFYVASGSGGPSSGILVVIAGDDPLSLSLDDTVKIGGHLQEFYCETQIRAMSVEKLGTAPSPPAPENVAAADLVAPATAEKWEGVLVRVANVKVASGPNNFGEYTLESGLVVDDLFLGDKLSLTVGQTLPSITGILRFSFGQYRLEPRAASDVALP